ncbi:MAG: hypothetical protein A2381_13600 [Bdellovibrionales bacterium RIFOXYB1_FULL_37_110]|nr:MAG: hypothetical protein A2417_05235 [Bdellovibrionales bacterium RIFOXYC1_FULL_37_79]OFZ56896.1 MAG: hypothetical protein A2381_13600 [Bdellovibrionales bacterium RIFOXYB1_FULL_37_110]OFZ61983.1 MAG: hypothetical protein A2577_19070 [Bdellovibrionales bacterium RIFOXYD1_FULL_36_51]
MKLKLLFFVSTVLFFVNGFSVEIILKDGQISSGKIYLPCSFDSIEYECFFDSGAERSKVPLVGFEDFQKVGEYESGGAAGLRKKYDEVIIGNLNVGEFSRVDFKIGRSQEMIEASPTIGSGFFSNSSLYFDFKHREIKQKHIPLENISSYPLKTLEGRPLIDVEIKASKLKGIWDTGAVLTTIDQDYIDKNLNSFIFIQDIEDGVDSTGTQVFLKLYILKEFYILTSKFENIYILGMDFSPMRKLGVPTDIQFIIGYNSIIKSNWYFDYVNQLWAIED